MRQYRKRLMNKAFQKKGKMELDLAEFVGERVVLKTTDGQTVRGDAVGYSPGLESPSGEDELEISQQAGSCVGFPRSAIAEVSLLEM